MSKDEFIATVGKLFDTDANYRGAATRTFTTGEMVTFFEHLWALFDSQGHPDYSSPVFIKALIRSRRHYSAQDQAAALPGLIQAEIDAAKNPPPTPRIP